MAPGSRGLAITGMAVSLGVTAILAFLFVALDFGWMSADPADMRKESPTKLAINNSKVTAARKGLFGSWELNLPTTARMTWLPGSNGRMPAETMSPRLDSLNPGAFTRSY
jgi:hypothetical protein